MTTQTTPLLAAAATRQGSEAPNMDAAAIFASQTGAIAAAVVDGIGKDPIGAKAMQLVADVAVRYAPTRSILAAILTAAGVVDDAGSEAHAPNGVIALALAAPGDVTLIGWVGDSHIYSWNGERLLRRTTPETMGEYLRQNGDIDLAPKHDNWIRVALDTSTPATVALAEIPYGEVVIIASDGLDETPLEVVESLVREHAEALEGLDPQNLADALVATSREDDDGYRDDATVVVLIPIPVDSGVQADAHESPIKAAELEFIAARAAGDGEGVTAALQKMRDAGVPAIAEVLEDDWLQRGR